MGITHHAHGVANVQAIANLALMRGMIGRPHCGLMPIRGHSNVQGIGSVGVSPKLKQAVFDALEREFGVELPTTPGLDTLGCIEAAHEERLKIGFCLGGNLYGSNPDAAFAKESLSRLDMLVYLNTTLNTGHANGLARETIFLPVLARDEEPQPTTQESMFNYVRLSDGGPRRHEGPRSEVEVIAEIAERTLTRSGSEGSIDWASMRSTGKIREAIAAVVPGFEKLATIDQTKQEFQITGRTFHQPRFPTADGRAVMHVHELPELAGGDAGATAGLPSSEMWVPGRPTDLNGRQFLTADAAQPLPPTPEPPNKPPPAPAQPKPLPRPERRQNEPAKPPNPRRSPVRLHSHRRCSYPQWSPSPPAPFAKSRSQPHPQCRRC
jgi:anaerobic selenocysteine-containing dehydrogenase